MFTESARGFLFIGDPHCSSRRPGRRKDDYLASVLGKLQECARICHEQKLIPVILGDLFHRNDDNELRMLNALARTLKLFPVAPIVLDGNHDKEQVSLSDADALTLLALGGHVQVAQGSAQVGVFDFEGRQVRLWGCGYGEAIPSDLGAFEGTTVLLSHHDMAFGSAYPGAAPLVGIQNCSLVVNGHMHDTKQSVLVDGTWWHNPGNIEPLSVDLAGHVPCAWEWTPDTPAGTLKPFQLPHGQDLFDMAGLQVAPAAADVAVADVAVSASRFAAMLGAQDEDAAKTDDASLMLSDLAEVLSASGVSEATQQLMQAVAANVVRAAQGQLAAPV